jgi:hypothetical protein
MARLAWRAVRVVNMLRFMVSLSNVGQDDCANAAKKNHSGYESQWRENQAHD